MEIRLILFEQVAFRVFLYNQLNYLIGNNLLSVKVASGGRSSYLRVSLNNSKGLS